MKKAACTLVTSDEVLRFATSAARQTFDDELRIGTARACNRELLSELVAATTPSSAGSTAANNVTDIAALLDDISTGEGSRLFFIVSPDDAKAMATKFNASIQPTIELIRWINEVKNRSHFRAAPAGTAERPYAGTATIWRRTVAAMKPTWFGPETWPLLVQFCRHTVIADDLAAAINKAGRPGDLVYTRLVGMLQRESMMIASLSTKMRLSHQSSRHPASLRQDPMAGRRKPWEPVD